MVRLSSEHAIPERLREADFRFDAPIWEQYDASDLFVVPTAVSGEGIKELLNHLEEVAARTRERRNKLISHDAFIGNTHQFLCTMNDILRHILDADNLPQTVAIEHEDQYSRNLSSIQTLIRRATDIRTYGGIQGTFYEQVRLVSRICLSIQELQQKHGEQLLYEPDSIAMLTVGIKCLDASWTELRRVNQEVKVFYANSGLDDDVQGDWVEEFQYVYNGVHMRLYQDIGADGMTIMEPYTDETESDSGDDDDPASHNQDDILSEMLRMLEADDTGEDADVEDEAEAEGLDTPDGGSEIGGA